jgi:hypothetical protein
VRDRRFPASFSSAPSTWPPSFVVIPCPEWFCEGSPANAGEACLPQAGISLRFYPENLSAAGGLPAEGGAGTAGSKAIHAKRSTERLARRRL